MMSPTKYLFTGLPRNEGDIDPDVTGRIKQLLNLRQGRAWSYNQERQGRTA